MPPKQIDEKINKKVKGSNRMVEPNRLIRDYNKYRENRYINIWVILNRCARVAEWLMQSFDTRGPYGFAGSIPAPGALFLFHENVQNKNSISKK